MSRAIIAALAIAGIATVGGLSAQSDEDPADFKKWLDSPVRYIATPAEIKAFKKLKTDNARAAFIESFWSRRDPEPDTLVNEARQRFWERVREANDLFLDSAKPGWRTDRGKVYVLYGPPNKIEDDPDASIGDAVSTAGRGVLRWHYEGSEHGRKDINPVVVVIPFVRDVTGEYRISHDVKLANEYYDLNTIMARSAYEEWLQTDTFSSGRSPLAVMLDMGRMQEIPPQEEVLLARVETIEVYGDEPLAVAVHRYRDPDGQGVLLTLSIAAPQIGSDPRAAILARLAPQGVPESSIVLGEGSFVFDGEGSARQAQGRVVLQPGSYELTVLVVIPASSSSSVYKGPLTVDPAEEGMWMSDVALALRLERVRYNAMASYREPYTVGSFHVVPKLDDRIERGQDLSLFYEVYGGLRPYRVTYELESNRDSGWVPASRAVVQEGAEGAQGWSVPTSDAWPAGRYRVRITVEDARGSTETADVNFELVPPNAS